MADSETLWLRLKDWWNTDCERCLNIRKAVYWSMVGGAVLIPLTYALKPYGQVVQLIALSGWLIFFWEKVHYYTAKKISVVYLNKMDIETEEDYDHEQFDSARAARAYEEWKGGMVPTVYDGWTNKPVKTMLRNKDMKGGCKECDEHENLIQTLMNKKGKQKVKVVRAKGDSTPKGVTKH